jgi:hypothetical protein
MSLWLVACGWRGLSIFLAGNPGDVPPRLHGPVLDLAHRPTGGFRLVDVINGKLSVDPY